MYLGYESFKCFCSMLFHVSLSSSKDIILLTKDVLSRNIPHLRSSWDLRHLRHLRHLWIHVEWSNIMPINMCCPIKVWKNQPATEYQLGIGPYGKPEISHTIYIGKLQWSWKLVKTFLAKQRTCENFLKGKNR